MTKEELVQKLISKKQAPFLFLGSGFSRHYIKTPDWRGILEMFDRFLMLYFVIMVKLLKVYMNLSLKLWINFYMNIVQVIMIKVF